MGTNATDRSHKRQLYLRDGGFCHYCRTLTVLDIQGKRAATRDHVVPKSMGGPNKMWNYVLACADCNNRRRDDLYLCDCISCTQTIAIFYNKYFDGIVGVVKTKVWKHRGEWVVSVGMNSTVVPSWKSAMKVASNRTSRELRKKMRARQSA